MLSISAALIAKKALSWVKNNWRLLARIFGYVFVALAVWYVLALRQDNKDQQASINSLKVLADARQSQITALENQIKNEKILNQYLNGDISAIEGNKDENADHPPARVILSTLDRLYAR